MHPHNYYAPTPYGGRLSVKEFIDLVELCFSICRCFHGIFFIVRSSAFFLTETGSTKRNTDQASTTGQWMLQLHSMKRIIIISDRGNYLMGCDAVYSGKYLPTCRRDVFHHLPYLRDLLNVSIYLPDYTVSHPRRK